MGVVRAGRPAEGDLDPWIEQFLSWLAVERGRSSNTVEAYRRDLGHFADWLRANKVPLEAVVGDEVAEYVRSLADAGRAPSSVARALAAIRTLFTFLASERLIANDPTALSEGVRVPAGVPKPLSEDEVRRVLSSVEGQDPQAFRDRALLELLYSTGARISEACGMNLDDVDFDSGLIRFMGKGAKERIVPIGTVASAALRAYLSDRGRGSLVKSRSVVSSDRDAVFLSTRGLRLSRQKAWAVVSGAGVRAGLGEPLSPHVLRHSCATHMLDHGADLRIVQEILGHASISTTQVYTKVSQERLFAVYRASHPRARAEAS